MKKTVLILSIVAGLVAKSNAGLRYNDDYDMMQYQWDQLIQEENQRNYEQAVQQQLYNLQNQINQVNQYHAAQQQKEAEQQAVQQQKAVQQALAAGMAQIEKDKANQRVAEEAARIKNRKNPQWIAQQQANLHSRNSVVRKQARENLGIQ
jgi:hypothetical protein